MLLSKLLLAKKTITNQDGEVMTDLISSTFDFGLSSVSSGPVIVSEECSMRPDTLSQKVYSTQDNWDLLLKYNGISNPFSLEEGEYLLAPPYKAISGMIRTTKDVPEKGTEPAKKNEQKLITPKTPKDTRRIESLRTQTSEVVPPNVNLSGTKNVVVKDGLVIYGPNITQATVDSQNESLARSRTQAQLKNNTNL
jgi:hypothetical protein